MGVFDWKPEYSVGDTRVDREHRELFARAGSLHQAMLAGRGVEAVADLLKALADYAHTHFRGEEEWMTRSGYPQEAAHRREHEEFRSVVRRMRREAGTKPVELMGYLGTWLRKHVMVSDQRIAAFRKEQGRGPELLVR